MRVPISWLNEFVEFSMRPDALAEGLTALGLKVEAIHRGALDIVDVVVGEVIDVLPHPQADKLVLVDVTTGDGSRRIVCGARNFSRGDRVPVVLPGGTLPGGKIEATTVRGERSEGMLCSPMELGLGEDHQGILILPSDAVPGADVREVLGLDEVVLELEITPNRPDAMGLIGVAREVAIMTGGDVVLPAASIEEAGPPSVEAAGVTVEDPSGCPRYLARIIRGLEVGPSPTWVQRRLTAAGVRPISNVVDATNYGLIVTGHPMHAFDLEKLTGPQIVVRRAREGERILTLDDQDVALESQDLVIADAAVPVAIAGVMGGSATEVSEATTDVLLESAYFDPDSILRTSKRLGMRTEASARFERGADPSIIPFAADYVCSLMASWAAGVTAPAPIDIYPEPVAERVVTVKTARVNDVLGTALDSKDMTKALSAVGLGVTNETGEEVLAVVPTRRPDITAAEDLIEEVARVVGYDTIPSTLPATSGRVGGLSWTQSALRRVKQVLVGSGFYETYTSSLVSGSDLDRVRAPQDGRFEMSIANPVSKDEEILRPTLMPGLLASASRNVARRRLSLRLFEVGRCFAPSDELLPREMLRLGLLVHGPLEKQWHSDERELDLYDLTGAIQAMSTAMRLGPLEIRSGASNEALHPHRAGSLWIGERLIGVFGEVAPEVVVDYDLPHRAVFSEIDLESVLSLSRPPDTAAAVSQFPATLLDLAVSVPEETPAGVLLAEVKREGGPWLEDARIFDVYRGPQAGEGRKSIALALRFRHPDRTLTDAEAVAVREKIQNALSKEFGAEIRA